MKCLKIAVVVGARPQFVKAAALFDAYKTFPGKKNLSLILIHTGQHYDFSLSGVFFKELSIPKPKHHLNVGSGSHALQTGQMSHKLETVFLAEKPDMVLVFGDTNSTLAAALSATKCHIPLAHVESGLRSYNKAMPEEINRVIADRISNILFCPTADAVMNLRKENITKHVHAVGDVMADILYRYRGQKSKTAGKSKPYYLATIHRNTNTDNIPRLESLLACLSKLDHAVILPLHPRTQNIIKKHPKLSRLTALNVDKLQICAPVPYKKMLQLQGGALAILTDSGGVQKEAFMLGVPCVTLRNETEWVETVKSGMNKLMPNPTPGQIITAVKSMKKTASSLTKKASLMYGDGRSSVKVLKNCMEYLTKS